MSLDTLTHRCKICVFVFFFHTGGLNITNQHPSASIRINQNKSAWISTNQHESASIKIDQHQSVTIRINQHHQRPVGPQSFVQILKIVKHCKSSWNIKKLNNCQIVEICQNSWHCQTIVKFVKIIKFVKKRSQIIKMKKKNWMDPFVWEHRHY